MLHRLEEFNRECRTFWGYGVQNFVTIFIKLIGSVTLIWLGWKIYGVMVAMLIGTILTILYCLCNLKSFFRELKKLKFLRMYLWIVRRF